MKKMLLILVSAMLIVSLAGPALAEPAHSIISPSNIRIIPDGDTEVTTTVTVNDIAYGVLGATHTRAISVETSDPNIQAKITGNGVDTGFVSTTRSTGTYSAVSPNEYKFTLTIKGTKAGIVTVSDNAGNSYMPDAAHDTTSVSTTVNVPEFPTVAAPIAGIIGLLFVFGRRKEGL